MRLVRDERFTYRGYHGRPAECWLRLYVEPDQRPVAIVTELPDNPGASVTNRAEHLATVVATLADVEFHADGGAIVWIEHYPGDPRYPKPDTPHGEHFSRVRFEGYDGYGTFHTPHWSFIRKAAVEDLIGQPFPAFTTERRA
jgi:hypothetical protein